MPCDCSVHIAVGGGHMACTEEACAIDASDAYATYQIHQISLEQVRNVDMLKRACIPNREQLVSNRCLRWVGHVARMTEPMELQRWNCVERQEIEHVWELMYLGYQNQ